MTIGKPGKVAALAMVLLVTGCASTPGSMSQDDYSQYLKTTTLQVDQLLAESKRDEAVNLLSKAAELGPASKEPWVRIARIQFDGGKYGEAIVAAGEVLQRDPADRVAKSVRAVSGLRVATESLADLRNDTEMTGSARGDAVALARVMRESLGESVLIPPPTPEELEARRLEEEREKAQKQKARPKARVKKSMPAASEGRPPAATAASGSGPFGALK
ncbi:tetratricopeptide repeat protein [Aromatoleum toluclasticum]|uniref:tetratricopeptide repeat protein n=1 Tax=Aromatoleum toluclasticum TaxID=92003 RepID=UPI001D1801EC|nr:tetratricopeptide repeat protein [Aromatoleum toluclasticum]MCC4116952.1 tetratricopeptide repeat protein [Aromatoleum toluclasticum]